MRAVTFKSVLWGVALRLGLDPQVNLQKNQAAAITEYINTHVRRGWEYFAWPELVTVEERRYRPDYDALVAYDKGDEVWDPSTEHYYVAVAAGTGQPVTDADSWKLQSTLNRYVSLDQPGQTPIGEVLGVYERNPNLNRAAGVLPYTLSEHGLQMRVDAPDSVWVQFRRLPPEFTAADWSSTADYATGDRVYLAGTGECYEALSSSTNKDPSAEAESWQRLLFPRVLSDYVKYAAYADALREDGQADKARMEEKRAQIRLEDEIEKVVGQQGIPHRFSVALT